ncbi:MAG: hypothetical protein HOV92_37230 [Streptomyces sp.]|nr:hypothetical protein [Streptomyces sp.]
MSGTEQQPPGEDTAAAAPEPEVLLAAMPPGRLSREQVHGAKCIWCAVELTNDTATDLWPRHDEDAFSWSPRGCRSCTEPRVTALTTYHAGLAHLEDCCANCIGGLACEVAGALRARHLEALSRIGQADIVCSRCCEAIDTTQEWFEPFIWDGETAPIHGYRHTPDCTDEDTSGADDGDH